MEQPKIIAFATIPVNIFGDIKAYYDNSLLHVATQLIVTLKILCVH